MVEVQDANAVYAGAFDNPVFQSQAVFRALMDGMARPGTVVAIDASAVPPEPMGRGAGAIALTLCDTDTPAWLTQTQAQSAVPAWLAFHTGAPVTDVKPEARFAFVEAGAMVPGFNQFALGTQDYPDRSTTLVIEIAALSGGPAMIGAGPGIKGEVEISPVGLPDIFLTLWNENRSVFPRGVDLVLVAGDAALCLPRTVKLRRKEA
ncbi:phosphonate C-P lyase system protein PhnH [Pararhizobium antarcticum]|uniref:Carbon-phosphorus lyase subunit PhnH n=1 Tax=Pararhizobium antarcticum TaxID=1798805 RepID=A0A657LN00_9HYPH|nr:phosphonate C-P lyase system protein PhnH [Pararhizobium antarcticum]OJF91319.1 carbon-phosphorus lyase subunit PhnH [Pararhizobium antarcticum]OJG01226.1 carbon-phosphorus lyase subunit PhnH [Rhizobium sp. 58]